jgi:hypothetical protein
VALTTHHPSNAEIKERVELYLYTNPAPAFWTFVAFSRMTSTLIFVHLVSSLLSMNLSVTYYLFSFFSYAVSYAVCLSVCIINC